MFNIRSVRKKMKRSKVVDRIGALPDELIHQIFSFLDMKLIVQTSIISKRWRFLWMYSPYLNFGLDMCRGSKKISRNQFVDFVDRVLLLREISTMKKFYVSYEKNLEAGRILTWVLTALRRKVQEFHLHSAFLKPVQLPPRLFTSEIEVMTIEAIGKSILLLPDSFCSNNSITRLKLVNVELPTGDANRVLNLSFAVLKKLVIGNCDYSFLKIFTLSAPQLEILEVTHNFGRSYGPIKTNIRTPNLRSFLYNGPICGDYFFENLSVLDSAAICLRETPDSDKGLFAQTFNEVLTATHNVKKLTIPDTLLQTLADFPYLLETLSSSFHNLRHIKLVGWGARSSIQTITSFLEKLPHLDTFVWSAVRNTMGMESDLVTGRTNLSLKNIEIQFFHGSEQELKVLGILLNMCLELEHVKIHDSYCLANRKKLETFKEKLSKLPRASPKVLINFTS